MILVELKNIEDIMKQYETKIKEEIKKIKNGRRVVQRRKEKDEEMKKAYGKMN